MHLVVHIIQRKDHLTGPFYYLSLGEKPAGFALLFDFGKKITLFCVVHDDVEAVSVNERLPKLHNEGVIELPKNFRPSAETCLIN